jgi:bacteriocin-like protein
MTRLPTSKVSELHGRELQDDELNAVSGGIIAVLIGLLLSDSRPSAPPPPPSK